MSAGAAPRTSTARLALAGALLLVYAAPLFAPPPSPPFGTVTPADAWLLERIFPGVAALWFVVRLVALAAGAVLLSSACAAALRRSLAPGTAARDTRIRAASRIALAVAIGHALSAPLAPRLGALGQIAYLGMLFVPALLLARPSLAKRPGDRWDAVSTAVVVAAWIAARLATDLDSPRVADVIDGWRGWIDVMSFIDRRGNFLTDLFDPNLPGVGGTLYLFHGLPLVQAGVLPLGFRTVQVFQIISLGGCALAIGFLARLLVGRGAAPVAAAVFLFAPYTRFMALFPGPFLAGPIYATAVALCAVLACRKRSQAALAALGACSGVALAFPGVVPTVALFVACTLWYLRGSLRALWVGIAAGLASFVAAVVPAIPAVLNPTLLSAHFRWDGLITIIDGGLLGQLPLGSTPPAWLDVSPRPFDIVVAALLAPFAHPRIGIRLWGDALFDPVGAALVAVGVAACARCVVRSSVARVSLLFFVAALCPAFVSPVDVVDIVHAVVLPVPVALLAAAGFAVVDRQLAATVATSWKSAVVAVAICVGGTVLFDVVNPRILSASSFGIMYQVLRPEDADRVIVLAYGRGFVRPTRTLYTGPITAFGGPRPVGYLEWDGGALDGEEFASAGKDLFFWSHGYDGDYPIAAAICRQWPGATLYEIWDDARRGRVHAARIGRAPWAPDAAVGRWQSWSCGSRPASPG